jgi:dihydropteroate synthase
MTTAGNTPWRIAGGRELTPAPFLITGIVNLSDDSFSGNGVPAGDAMREIRRQVSEGAHIVDLGAESTRPGATDIGAEEEQRRLAPVLPEAIAYRQASGTPGSPPAFALSVDTYRASTAAWALSPPNDSPPAAGVDIINDISGGAFDPGMDEVLAEFKPGYVLGHCPERPAVMHRLPRYDNVADELMRWFSERTCICLDPCIGFAKNLEHNLAVIAAIPRFLTLGRPLFFGISRKSLIGDLTGLPLSERDTATQVLTALLAGAGVAIHRVHQVGITAQTLRLTSALAPYLGPAS